jgi:glycine cleavage system aminomethyltransferase T
MTCRDLSKSKDGRCYYCPIIDDQAGLINDPVVLRHNEKKWWISIADSDVILFAKGLAIGNKFEVKIIEPNVNIMAVQGPKSFKLMEKIFGEEITKLIPVPATYKTITKRGVLPLTYKKWKMALYVCAYHHFCSSTLSFYGNSFCRYTAHRR